MTELLLVDDSAGALRSLAHALSTAGSTHRVTRIIGADAALAQLERRPAHVLLACVTNAAPAAECAQMFARMAVAAPGTVRLALLDPAHGEGRDGTGLPPRIPFAHQCIPLPKAAGDATAPALPSTIGAVLSSAMDVAHALRSAPALQRLLCGLDDIPSPPALYFDMREELHTRHGTLAGMGAIAARDPALAARVLKAANSGFFGLPRSVASLQEAIALIGGNALLALVLSTHLYDALPPPGVNLELLWQHAADVSASARAIARSLGGSRAQQESAATAGLLHDIGLLVLLRGEPARYQPLWRRAAGDEHALAQLEREAFGVSHDALGATVLTLWSLPQEVVDAVRHSHATGATDMSLVARAVLAAEWLQHEAGNDIELPSALADIGNLVSGGLAALRTNRIAHIARSAGVARA